MMQTDDKTTIRFYMGTRNIGGPVMSVTHNRSRVIFDFGAIYDPAGNPFDGVVEPRFKGKLADAIRLKQVPAVDGLFAEAELGSLADTIVPAEKSELETAVLISHLHLDHMANIGFVHPSIPVYMEENALNLLQALDEIGEGTGERSYSSFKYGEAFTTGEIKVTPSYSDHSVWGAAGLLIQTPAGNIFWSGDVRFHGLQADRAFADVRKLAEERIDLMIMEGSTLSVDYYQAPDPKCITESQYLQDIGEALSANDKVTFFNLYHRNVGRMLSLVQVAEESGRRIALEPESAYVLQRITGQQVPVYVPDYDLFAEDGGHQPQWLQQLLGRCERVTQEDILSEPGRWFVQNSYKHVMELFDYAHIGGVYMHLDGIPLGAYDPAFANLHRILARANMTYWNNDLQPMFGHAIPKHLQEMADIIDPAYLAVIHSKHPERLNAKSGTKILPQDGEVYTLSGGRLEKDQP